jgi:hypothetical protein
LHDNLLSPELSHLRKVDLLVSAAVTLGIKMNPIAHAMSIAARITRPLLIRLILRPLRLTLIVPEVKGYCTQSSANWFPPNLCITSNLLIYEYKASGSEKNLSLLHS